MEQLKDGRCSTSAYFAFEQEVHVFWHGRQGYGGRPSVVAAHIAEEDNAELWLEGPRSVPGCLPSKVNLHLDWIQGLASVSASASRLLKEAPVMKTVGLSGLSCRLYACQEKPTVQLIKKFPEYYETRWIIFAFTNARHLSLYWARSIQSISPHPNSREILFNIILPSTNRCSKLSLSLRFCHQKPVGTSPVSHTCHMSSTSHSSLFDQPTDSWWPVQIIKQERLYLVWYKYRFVCFDDSFLKKLRSK